MKILFHAFRAGWTYSTSSIVNQVDHSQISQELLYGRLNSTRGKVLGNFPFFCLDSFKIILATKRPSNCSSTFTMG